MLVTYYSYGGVDPSVVLSTNLLSPQKNLPHYVDYELTQLMSKGYRTTDFELRKQVYYRIQEIIADEVPFSVIASLPAVGAATSYVEGLWLQPSWSNPIYHEVWLNK
jgi:ABC-type transport system substrate-binding protein